MRPRRAGRRTAWPVPHSSFAFRRRRSPGPRGTAAPGALSNRSKRPDDQILNPRPRDLAARSSGQVVDVIWESRAQVRDQRTAAVDAGVGVTDALLGGAAVVHREGVEVQRQPSARQHSVVGAWRASNRSIIGITWSARTDACASMRRRCVGLDGSNPTPSTCLKNSSPRRFSIASKSLLPCTSKPRWLRTMSLVATPVRTAKAASTLACAEASVLSKCPTRARAGGRGEVAVELLDLDRAHGQIVRAEATHRHWVTLTRYIVRLMGPT